MHVCVYTHHQYLHLYVFLIFNTDLAGLVLLGRGGVGAREFGGEEEAHLFMVVVARLG